VSARSTRGTDPVTARYVAAWVLTAAAVLLGVTFAADRAVWGQVGLSAIAAYVVAVAVAERVQLHLTVQRAEAAFTLIEVAITAGLLLLPAPVVVLGTAAGTLLAQLARGLRGVRLGFNAAIATIGSALAAGVVALFPAVGPLVNGRAVLGALLGMLLYATVNALAMAGLILRFAGADTWQELRAQVSFAVATIAGTSSLGVVVAALWVHAPTLTVFALAPAAAVHLAARGARRTRELLDEVRVERDRLTRVVDGASDGIVLLDREGRIQVWSRAMEALTGRSADDTVGREVAQVLTGELRQAPATRAGGWLLATDVDTAPEFEATLRHVDGTERVVRESHALLRDERGRARGEVVVVRDVSRQARLERLRSDFIGRVSHELRSPLTPIRGYARTLRARGGELDAEQRDTIFERIVDRADHLSRLIDDLLLVTRFDVDDLRGLVEVTTVDLTGLVDHEVARFRAACPDRPVTTDPGVAVAARADAGHVRRILAALLDNADRYSAPSDAIRVTVRTEGAAAVVAVLDAGPGIPADQREAVFEPFHRLEDPLTMRTGGVGLGLFLSRRLAELMGGELCLRPAGRGEGTCLELRLPKDDAGPA
jgi:PAS domain S-box-containing protein